MGLFGNWLGSSHTSNKTTYKAGQGILDAGTGIEDKAIAGINSDIGGYGDLIKGGGLTPALGAQFNVARARVLDRGTSERLGLRTNLAQRSLETPGGLSPQAAAELEAGGNENIGANEFGATQDVNASEAMTGFNATNALMDKIAAARKAVLGAGSERMNLGAGLMSSSLANMNALRQALIGYSSKMMSGAIGGA